MAKMRRLQSEVRTLELAEVGNDERYQRGVQRHHEYIKGEFNPDAAGILKVAQRPDKSLWMLDGEQRKAAMLKLGITKWRCEVIYCDTIEYEATVFRLVNDRKGRKSLSTRDLFKAALASKDPIALGLTELLAKHGLKPSLSGGARNYPYVKPLGLLYRLYAAGNGPANLDLTFALIHRMWPEDEEGLHEAVLGALSLIYRQREFDAERFVRTVGSRSPRLIRQQAEGAGAGGNSRYSMVADRMIAIYNTKLSYGSKNALRLFADRAPKDEPEDESKEVS